MIRVSEKSAPGVWGGLMCRKRYIDEKLIESVDRIEAVVILGAGFDTRAYRLRALAEQYLPIAQDKARMISDRSTQISNKATAPIINLYAKAAQVNGLRKAIFRRKNT